MCPENPEGIQVMVGSMNMGYISARNRHAGLHTIFELHAENTPAKSPKEWQQQGHATNKVPSPEVEETLPKNKKNRKQ